MYIHAFLNERNVHKTIGSSGSSIKHAEDVLGWAQQLL